MNKDFHERIISKEQFEEVQLEIELCSNEEVLEDGTVCRKSKKIQFEDTKMIGENI